MPTCNYCDVTVVNNLKRHQSSQKCLEARGKTLDLKFVCEFCNTKFSRSDQLNRHSGTCKKSPKVVQNKLDKLLSEHGGIHPYIKEAQKLAHEKGGKCLTDMYTNSTRFLWLCSSGHEWYTELYTIRRGQWCQKCYHISKRNTLEHCQKLAESKGGKCLSEFYTTKRTHMNWMCAKGKLL